MTGAVSAIHAGWRGTAAGAVLTAEQALCEKFGTEPTNIIAAVEELGGITDCDPVRCTTVQRPALRTSTEQGGAPSSAWDFVQPEVVVVDRPKVDRAGGDDNDDEARRDGDGDGDGEDDTYYRGDVNAVIVGGCDAENEEEGGSGDGGAAADGADAADDNNGDELDMVQCGDCGAQFNIRRARAHKCPREPRGPPSDEDGADDHIELDLDGVDLSPLAGSGSPTQDEIPTVAIIAASPIAVNISPPKAPPPPAGAAASSPGRSPPSAGNAFTPKPAQKNKLFYRMGNTFTIPTDDLALRRIFDSYRQDADGNISQSEFAGDFKEFEGEMGVVPTDRDMETRFRKAKASGDNTLSFKSFQMFLLNHAKQ